MLRTFRASLIGLVLSLPFAPNANAQHISVAPEDGSPAMFTAGWYGDGAGNMVVIWAPSLREDGTVAVCGVYAMTNNFIRQGVDQMLRRATVNVDGQRVLRNVRKFKRASSVQTMGQTVATCIETEARGQWNEVEIVFGEGSFRG